MTKPMIVDLPHKLGAAEAKRRIAGGMGSLRDQLPGGADVRSGWEGDRMNLQVKAMGQEVGARIDVGETIVRLEVQLPAFLSFFGSKVESLIRRHGTELLEDKSGRSG
jgi:Putative polyhydroxyalkanoic acid system protein (PHA_gran_rgn)